MSCNDYEPTGNKIYVIGNTNPISPKVMFSELRNGLKPYFSGSANMSNTYPVAGQAHANYQMTGLKYNISDVYKNMKGIDSKVYEIGQEISDVSEKISSLELSNMLLTEHVGRLENLLEQLAENMNAYKSKRTATKAYPIVYDGLAATVEDAPSKVIYIDFSKKRDSDRKAA